jgi:Entner-Doudoroff aldolase
MAPPVRLRTTAILRALEAQRAAEIAQRCWTIGMDLVEVPVQGDAGWAALESVAHCSGGRAFGAGTVLTPDDVRRAIDVGASVIISPDVNAEVVETAQSLGALPLPGVMTPTDVGIATRLGLSVCKLFPASVVGRGWLGALRGPFPAMDFIAVGGVDAGNAEDYLRAGACGVAFGTSIEALLEQDDAAGVIARLHAVAGT